MRPGTEPAVVHPTRAHSDMKQTRARDAVLVPGAPTGSAPRAAGAVGSCLGGGRPGRVRAAVLARPPAAADRRPWLLLALRAAVDRRRAPVRRPRPGRASSCATSLRDVRHPVAAGDRRRGRGGTSRSGRGDDGYTAWAHRRAGPSGRRSTPALLPGLAAKLDASPATRRTTRQEPATRRSTARMAADASRRGPTADYAAAVADGDLQPPAHPAVATRWAPRPLLALAAAVLARGPRHLTRHRRDAAAAVRRSDAPSGGGEALPSTARTRASRAGASRAPSRRSPAGDRLDDLEVDLELGLGAARAHDDAGAVGEVVAQPLGGRQPAVPAARSSTRSTGDPAELRGRRLDAQPLHAPSRSARGRRPAPRTRRSRARRARRRGRRARPAACGPAP